MAGRSTSIRQGDVTFTISGGLEDLVRRAVEQVSPTVLAAVEREVATVADAAADQWPVKTGESKAGLTMTTIIADDSVAARIYNRVPYAFFIRPKDLGGRQTAWNTFVRQPMHDAAKHLAEDLLGPAVARMVEG